MDDGVGNLGGRKSWLPKVILLISLGVNCVAIGFWAAHWLSPSPTYLDPAPARSAAAETERPPRLSGGQMSPRRLITALPEPYRNTVRTRLGRQGREGVQRLQAVSDARLIAIETLKQEPFDAGAARSALADLTRAEAELRAGGHDLFIAILDELPPEVRRTALESALQARGGRRGPRRPMPGPPPDGARP